MAGEGRYRERVSNPLTRDDVAQVARLAMLSIDDAELDQYTEQLGAILHHARDMAALDLDDVAPTRHPYPLVNVMRPDVVETFDRYDEVLSAAPAAQDNMFMVPPALGEEP